MSSSKHKKDNKPEDIKIIGRCFNNTKANLLRLTNRKDAPPIIFFGETGTGKSHLAKWLSHKLVKIQRREGIISQSAAGMSYDLFRSELFGYKKGSHSTAYVDTPGWLEQANNKILFIDEIGELDIASQGVLLKVIQDGEYCRIGETKIRKVNCQWIFATDLTSKEELEIKLRKQFLARCKKITLPSLYDHPRDIPIFLQKELLKLGFKKISNRALIYVMDYGWPKNIRELLMTMKYVHQKKNQTLFTKNHLDGDIGDFVRIFEYHYNEAKETIFDSYYDGDTSLTSKKFVDTARKMHTDMGTYSGVFSGYTYLQDFLATVVRNRASCMRRWLDIRDATSMHLPQYLPQANQVTAHQTTAPDFHAQLAQYTEDEILREYWTALAKAAKKREWTELAKMSGRRDKTAKSRCEKYGIKFK